MEDTTPHLELEVGTPVQMQFGTDAASQRYVTKIIGYAEPISIILNTPQVNGKPILLREGQISTVRFLGSNNVYAFMTNLKAVFLKPFPHIHVAYPSDIKSALVRHAERVRTDIKTTVLNISNKQKGEIKANVINISANGALIANPEVIGEVGDKLRLTIRVDYKNIEKMVAIAAVIRNIREGEQEDAGQFLHGVQFKIGTITDHLLVQGVVYSQLNSG